MNVNDVMTLVRTDPKAAKNHFYYVRERSRRLLGFPFPEPDENAYEDAARHLTEVAGLVIDAALAKDITDLRPEAKRRLSDWGYDSGARWQVFSALSNVVLGSDWPTRTSNIEDDEFLTVLREQGRRLGFKLDPNWQLTSSVLRQVRPDGADWEKDRWPSSKLAHARWLAEEAKRAEEMSNAERFDWPDDDDDIQA